MSEMRRSSRASRARRNNNLQSIGNGRYRLTFPDKGTMTVYANSEREAVRKINQQLKPKHMLSQKKVSKYWTFPNGKPTPNNYVWDGRGWMKKSNNKVIEK
jgi:hypothetical protein